MEPLDAPRWRAWRTFLIFLVFLAVCALCVSVAAADPFVYLAHLGLNIHDADAFRSLALSALAIAVTAGGCDEGTVRRLANHGDLELADRISFEYHLE